MDAVNQETIFSKINFETNSFSKQSKEDRLYFQEYVEFVSDNNCDVYLLEYTKDKKLIKK